MESKLSSAAWSDYITASGSPITSPPGRWIEVEATLESTDTNVTPLLHDITVTYGNNPGDILWQTDVPVSLAQGAVSNLNNAITALGVPGKYYLQGFLTSTTGQTLATSEYPFYVAQGNTLLSLNPDKKTYKPGEKITITGEVKNLSTVDATNLSLTIKGQASGGAEQALATETFSIPVGGSRPFTVSTTAGAEGTVALSGTVTQNSATLAQISDQYVIAVPQVTASASAPDVAGNDPFTVSLRLTNVGKTDATITVGKSFDSTPETMTIPTGETRFLQYPQQITADATYTLTITGDLNQTLSKTVTNGLAATVAFTSQAIYPEGKVTVPITLANTGLLDNQFSIGYQLTRGTNSISQQTNSYFLAKDASATDTLLFDLTEGSYQLTASGQSPPVTVSAAFQVRKETKVDLALTLGVQSGEFLPATVALTNLGYSPIEGDVRLSLTDSQGNAVWSATQEVSLPQALVPTLQPLAFAINLAAVKPSNFTIKAELLDTANRQLAVQTAPFTLLGAVFDMTQLPPYQTVPAGGSATMTFKVKNSGNQEGSFDLSFKADDLIGSTQTAWLKPGEEKEVAFTFQTAPDLEEKDYTATYRLKSGGATVREGIVTYHLAGIKLTVTATLDKVNYPRGRYCGPDFNRHAARCRRLPDPLCPRQLCRLRREAGFHPGRQPDSHLQRAACQDNRREALLRHLLPVRALHPPEHALYP